MATTPSAASSRLAGLRRQLCGLSNSPVAAGRMLGTDDLVSNSPVVQTLTTPADAGSEEDAARLNAMPLPEGPPGRLGSNLNYQGTDSMDPQAPALELGVMIFENERIRVWDRVVDPAGPDGNFSGGCTGWHRHEHDYCFMNVHGCADGQTALDQMTPEGEIVRQSDSTNPIREKAVLFMKGVSHETPAIHNLYNASTKGRLRQINVEFLETKPRHSEKEVEAMFQRAAALGYSTDVGTTLLFENDRCRVWDFSLAPHSGESRPFHVHTLDCFSVATCGGPDNAGSVEQGLRGWSGPGALHEGLPQNVNVRATDRDCVWEEMGDTGGFDKEGNPLKCAKVWNHLDVPYHSFLIELK